MQDVVKLAIDTYKGSLGTYSKEQANEVLRKALIEANGGVEKIDYKSMRKNKAEIFEILEETLSILVAEGIDTQFSDFAEIRNLSAGDTNVFRIPNHELFKVATIADGHNSLRRQRLDSSEMTVGVSTKGVKIYEEFHRFLAGRIDWVDMVNRVARSYNQQVSNDVYSAIYNSFSVLTAPFSLSSAYNESSLIDMAQHVEAAAGGAGVTVFGTKKSLAKVATDASTKFVSNDMMNQRQKLGYFGTVAGMELREIKQAHDVGTFNWAINDSFLLVVPNVGDKFVKIVNEGDAIIVDQDGSNRADFQMDYTFIMKSGIAVMKSAQYGIFRLS